MIDETPFVIAYLVVLTINTLHVAMRKKNIHYPIPPANDRFFAYMIADRRNIECCIAFAISEFVRKAIHTTVMRTNRAVF